MSAMVFFSACLVFVLFVLAFSGIGKSLDHKNRRMEQIVGETRKEVDEELNLPFMQRFLAPFFYSVLKFFSRFFAKNKQKGGFGLEKKLKLAGIRISTSEYSAARFIVMLGVIGIFLILAIFVKGSAVTKAVVVFLGVIFSLLGPSYYLTLRIKTRQQAIRNQMPDVLDLLTVSVEAGLGFDAAILKIQERFCGPLVDELMVVQREIQMAIPRREALKKFSDRNSVVELKTFAGAVIQADKLGIPMKNVLRSQSAQLRLSRKQVAEEKAMKAPVKMMLPLILFVFPVIFIILLGPTVLQIVETFAMK